MKGFLLCVIVLTGTLVKTEEPMSEKPIKEVADEFQTEFAQRFVEFDAVITDATWSDGWATINVVSKHPRNSKTPPGCLLNGRVSVTSSTGRSPSRRCRTFHFQPDPQRPIMSVMSLIV